MVGSTYTNVKRHAARETRGFDCEQREEQYPMQLQQYRLHQPRFGGVSSIDPVSTPSRHLLWRHQMASSNSRFCVGTSRNRLGLILIPDCDRRQTTDVLRVWARICSGVYRSQNQCDADLCGQCVNNGCVFSGICLLRSFNRIN